MSPTSTRREHEGEITVYRVMELNTDPFKDHSVSPERNVMKDGQYEIDTDQTMANKKQSGHWASHGGWSTTLCITTVDCRIATHSSL